MNRKTPPASPTSLNQLPTSQKERHVAFVDMFGQWLFWHRNQILEESHNSVNSEDERNKLGAIRRKYYERIATMAPEQREAALQLTREILDTFIERLTWSLGDEGTDCQFDEHHAYRFRVELEIVDAESKQVVEESVINRGGVFFGKNWGRWLNRFNRR